MRIISCSCGCNKTELTEVDNSDINKDGSVTVPAYVNRMDDTPFKNLYGLKRVIFSTPTIDNHKSLSIRYNSFYNCPNLRKLTIDNTDYNVINLLVLIEGEERYCSDFMTYIIKSPLARIDENIQTFTGTILYMQISKESKEPTRTYYNKQFYIACNNDNFAVANIKSLEESVKSVKLINKIIQDNPDFSDAGKIESDNELNKRFIKEYAKNKVISR